MGVHGVAAGEEDEWVRGGEAGRPPPGAAVRNAVPRRLEAYKWLQVSSLTVGRCACRSLWQRELVSFEVWP